MPRSCRQGHNEGQKKMLQWIIKYFTSDNVLLGKAFNQRKNDNLKLTDDKQTWCHFLIS